MSTDIRVDDVGKVFRLTLIDDDIGTPLNLSSAYLLEIHLKPPNRDTLRRTAKLTNDGTDGKIEYTTVQGDLYIDGTWKLQGYVRGGGYVNRTEIFTFDVGENLAASYSTGADPIEPTGIGLLDAQAATITGSGFAARFGTGALVANASSMTGIGAGVTAQITGTATLAAQSADVDGAGNVVSESITGTASLAAQAAAIAGAGTLTAAESIYWSGTDIMQWTTDDNVLWTE
jgi:hypothetical protein